MSKENIIKNPLRNSNNNNNKYAPYIPQYKKLNMEPEEQFKAESSGSDFKLSDSAIENYIDNNEYVSDEVAEMMGHEVKKQSMDKEKKININQENKFILIVNDIPITSSNSDDVIKQNIELLLLGEHNKFMNKKIALEDIFLYKRLNISYGAYFKE